jgi:polysaccharide biosynthesis/export protein
MRRWIAKMTPSALTLTLTATLVGGCATGRSSFDYSKEPDPRTQEYVVGPADELRVNVWKDPELSLNIKVRPDGTFTMPLVGDVRASGKTPTQVRSEIERGLAAFFKEQAPKVTVAVTAVNSYRFAVSGNVESPGLFNAQSYVTVLEAIAMAGGPNRFAAADRAVILRSYGPGRSRQIPINYDTMKTGQHTEQNIVVLPGDTIFVP